MSKGSASIERLWQRACREAITGRFAAIQSKHDYALRVRAALSGMREGDV